jgi:hypothetical protein
LPISVIKMKENIMTPDHNLMLYTRLAGSGSSFSQTASGATRHSRSTFIVG